MRCQPLRRALVSIKKNHQKLRFNVLKNQLSSCPTWFFEFQADAALVESVGSSTVSKSLKINKPRSFNVVGFSTRSVWFHK